MELSPTECRLFYKLHPALMCYANRRLKTLPDQPGDPVEFYALEAEKRVKVRDALHAQPELIDQFIAENPFGFGSEESEVVRSWKHAVVGSFYIFRHLKHYTVFLSSEKVPKAFGVLALADPFGDLIGPHLPRLIQTVLLPFQGKIVYDGLLSGYNLTFGGGIKRMLNDTYGQAKADFGIITSLPFEGEEPEPEEEPEAVIVTYGRFGEAHETRIGGKKEAPTFPLRLTQAQRRAVAGLFPQFADRLQLDEPNQRNPRFTLSELRQIFSQCRRAFSKGKTGMKKTSLRHVIDLADKAVQKYQEGSIARIPATQRLYQFKITLKDFKPQIWRRIQVKDCTLDKLHEHIQTAMGWTNSHLHHFKIDDQLYGDPMLVEENFEEMDYEDSTAMKLSEVVPKSGKRFRFEYEYDFGDGWEHEVLFEGCLRAEKGTRYPLCLEGERACPPEDVGGVWGYQEYLEAIADPECERHDELLEWSGPFDPQVFDAKVATKRMRRGLPKWREMEWM
jgi:hypothetical protein